MVTENGSNGLAKEALLSIYKQLKVLKDSEITAQDIKERVVDLSKILTKYVIENPTAFSSEKVELLLTKATEKIKDEICTEVCKIIDDKLEEFEEKVCEKLDDIYKIEKPRNFRELIYFLFARRFKEIIIVFLFFTVFYLIGMKINFAEIFLRLFTKM